MIDVIPKGIVEERLHQFALRTVERVKTLEEELLDLRLTTSAKALELRQAAFAATQAMRQFQEQLTTQTARSSALEQELLAAQTEVKTLSALVDRQKDNLDRGHYHEKELQNRLTQTTRRLRIVEERLVKERIAVLDLRQLNTAILERTENRRTLDDEMCWMSTKGTASLILGTIFLGPFIGFAVSSTTTCLAANEILPIHERQQRLNREIEILTGRVGND